MIRSPLKRVNPSGQTRWVARYTGRDGKPHYAGTFDLKRDAQTAIDNAYKTASPASDTVGNYAATWTDRHPSRSLRTARGYNQKLRGILPVDIDGRPLADIPLNALRRRHVVALVNHLLGVQGRAADGARGFLRVLSTMYEDAINDDLADSNPVKGVRVKASDPRAAPARAPRVFSFEDLHRFASYAGHMYARNGEPRPVSESRRQRLEPMLRTFTDTGMRLGEVLPLRRQDFDGHTLHVTRNVDELGVILNGTKNDHGDAIAGRHVPVGPALAELIRAMVPRIDSDLLFPTPAGGCYMPRNFYRDVWDHARRASGLDVRPHDCRHSFISHMRAAGINDADLALACGHTVATMVGHYTHAVGGDAHDQIRRAIG